MMLVSCSALSSVARISSNSKLRPKFRQDVPRRAQLSVRAYTVTLKFPEGEEKVVECDGAQRSPFCPERVVLKAI